MAEPDEHPADAVPLRIDDPHTLKALSHPLRLRLLTELSGPRPRNVTSLAALVGEPPNSVSYHLAQLARHGLVRRVDSPPGSRRNERWYESVSTAGFAIDYRDDDPATVAAMTTMKDWVVHDVTRSLEIAFDQSDEAQQRNLPLGSASVGAWLTPEEAHALDQQLEGVVRFMADKLNQQGPLRADPALADGLVYYRLHSLFHPDLSDDPVTPSYWDERYEGTFASPRSADPGDGPARA